MVSISFRAGFQSTASGNANVQRAAVAQRLDALRVRVEIAPGRIVTAGELLRLSPEQVRGLGLDFDDVWNLLDDACSANNRGQVLSLSDSGLQQDYMVADRIDGNYARDVVSSDTARPNEVAGAFSGRHIPDQRSNSSFLQKLLDVLLEVISLGQYDSWMFNADRRQASFARAAGDEWARQFSGPLRTILRLPRGNEWLQSELLARCPARFSQREWDAIVTNALSAAGVALGPPADGDHAATQTEQIDLSQVGDSEWQRVIIRAYAGNPFWCHAINYVFGMSGVGAALPSAWRGQGYFFGELMMTSTIALRELLERVRELSPPVRREVCNLLVWAMCPAAFRMIPEWRWHNIYLQVTDPGFSGRAVTDTQRLAMLRGLKRQLVEVLLNEHSMEIRSISGARALRNYLYELPQPAQQQVRDMLLHRDFVRGAAIQYVFIGRSSAMQQAYPEERALILDALIQASPEDRERIARQLVDANRHMPTWYEEAGPPLDVVRAERLVLLTAALR